MVSLILVLEARCRRLLLAASIWLGRYWEANELATLLFVLLNHLDKLGLRDLCPLLLFLCLFIIASTSLIELRVELVDEVLGTSNV